MTIEHTELELEKFEEFNEAFLCEFEMESHYKEAFEAGEISFQEFAEKSLFWIRDWFNDAVRSLEHISAEGEES